MQRGAPKLDLHHLVDTTLAAEIEGAARTAIADGRGVRLDGVHVAPLHAADDGSAQLLVSFAADETATAPSRESLSAALQFSNEELDSSHEELQALTEELRASNDLLNAANEDLSRVNLQLRDKLAELETQSNVLSSGEVMTLFLDEDLRIRWFTPAMVDLFPLRTADVGRRITDLVPHYADSGFVDHIAAVMRDGTAHVTDVTTADGRWYQRYIRPFRSDNRTVAYAGVAITFANVTELKRVERALRQSEEWLGGLKEAFMAATSGASLDESLDILVRTACAELGDGARCAFVLADDPSCAVVEVHTGELWSFPIETAAGKVVGTFTMRHRTPRDATPRDLELAGVMTHAAAIIISRAA